MDPAALVGTAAQRFVDGTDASFLACFDAGVKVYWEPALSERPIVSSRTALEAWLARTREAHPALKLTVTEPSVHGQGAVCEVIVLQEAVPGAEVWRVALAACVADGLIREVRAFWALESAMEWLLDIG